MELKKREWRLVAQAALDHALRQLADGEDDGCYHAIGRAQEAMLELRDADD